MSLQKKQSMDKEMFRTIISENQEYIGSIPLAELSVPLTWKSIATMCLWV